MTFSPTRFLASLSTLAFAVCLAAPACSSSGGEAERVTGPAPQPTAGGDSGTSADGGGCSAGKTCAYVTAVCVRAPCGPAAACVANNPCDAVRCAGDTVCEVGTDGAASCVAAAPRCGGIGVIKCNGKATCIDDPLATCRSATPMPDQDGICICDVDAATAACAATERFDASASVCACVAK